MLEFPNYDDPARVWNRTLDEVRRRGAIFNINYGIDIDRGNGCITRLVGWPGSGTRMVSFHLLIHKPGGALAGQSHPISETSMTCIRGAGEVNFNKRGWERVEAGNLLFAPMGCTYETRCAPGSKEDFIVLQYICPSPMEFYQALGLASGGDLDYFAIDKATLGIKMDSIPRGCTMRPNKLGGIYHGETIGAKAAAEGGAVFNIFRGAPFNKYGGPMRFLIWPGVGAKMCGVHNAYHDPGVAFKPHLHPISEDAVLFWNGIGDGYLESRWIECYEGDILYAPALVKHGTGCMAHRPRGMSSSGCATPPQFDLYEYAGYLKDGKFTEFTFEDSPYQEKF